MLSDEFNSNGNSKWQQCNNAAVKVCLLHWWYEHWLSCETLYRKCLGFETETAGNWDSMDLLRRIDSRRETYVTEVFYSYTKLSNCDVAYWQLCSLLADVGIWHKKLHYRWLTYRATHLCDMQWWGWPPKTRTSPRFTTPNLVILCQRVGINRGETQMGTAELPFPWDGDVADH